MSASTAGGRANFVRGMRRFVVGAMITSIGVLAFGGSANADPFGVGLDASEATARSGGSTGTEPSLVRQQARIGKVTVRGPRVIRINRIATYNVKIKNAGGATATGIRLRVSGRGLTFSTSVADIGPGNSRTTTVSVRPRKKGKIRAKFRVTSDNAGNKTVRKNVVVKGKRNKVPVTG